ncbi:MAG: hypothetical protein ACOC1O_00795 [bacterium]
MKIINGNEFSRLAHYSLDFHLNKWELNESLLNKNAIIFCKIEYIRKLFNFIKNSNKKYILITHDSDFNIHQQLFNSAPKCIHKWFGVNAIHDHPKLINIPLGIENEIVRHKPKSRIDYKWLRENLARLRNKDKNENVVYCNWNNKTNPERSKILSILKQSDVKIIQESGLSQYEYYEQLAKYKYVVCPIGNGIDTHRLWETLYVGSIPITIDSIIYRDYNLPIIRLKQWTDLNSKLLEEFNFRSNYNYYELDMKYWETFILDEYKIINQKLLL